MISRYLVIAMAICATVQTDSLSQSTGKIVWKFQTGGMIYATPSLHEEVLYVGSLDSTLYAVNRKNGSEIWRFRSGAPIYSDAAISGDRICFESGNFLYGLDLDGELQWKAPLYTDSITQQVDPWDFLHSSPVIYQGVAYIGSDMGWIYGIRLRDGKQVFIKQTDSGELIRTTPVISDGLILVGDWAGIFHAFDLKTGGLGWKYDTRKDGTFAWPNAIQSTPVVANGRIIFGGRCCRLYALDLQSGNRIWMYSSPTDQWLIGGPSLADGTLYLGSSDQKILHAIDPTNGELLWTREVDGRIWGKPLAVDKNLVIGSIHLFVLDRKNGETRTEYTFPNVHPEKKYGNYIDRTINFHSSPTLGTDLVFIGSDDGYIYAIPR